MTQASIINTFELWTYVNVYLQIRSEKSFRDIRWLVKKFENVVLGQILSTLKRLTCRLPWLLRDPVR